MYAGTGGRCAPCCVVGRDRRAYRLATSVAIDCAPRPVSLQGDIPGRWPTPTSCRLVGCQGYMKPPRSSKSEPYLTATPQTLASGSRKLKPYPQPDRSGSESKAAMSSNSRSCWWTRTTASSSSQWIVSAKPRNPRHQRRIAARTSSRRKARERRRLRTETRRVRARSSALPAQLVPVRFRSPTLASQGLVERFIATGEGVLVKRSLRCLLVERVTLRWFEVAGAVEVYASRRRPFSMYANQ